MGLVSLPNSYLSTLGIGTLKAILYENHVRVDFKQVLEKWVPLLCLSHARGGEAMLMGCT